jgi:hypothetical protein
VVVETEEEVVDADFGAMEVETDKGAADEEWARGVVVETEEEVVDADFGAMEVETDEGVVVEGVGVEGAADEGVDGSVEGAACRRRRWGGTYMDGMERKALRKQKFQVNLNVNLNALI